MHDLQIVVNTGFEYQDHMILKIWDTYIKQKQLSFYYAGLDQQQLNKVPSLASRGEMSFDLLSGLVINNDDTLYCPTTYSFSICAAIDFLNNTANAQINAITAPLDVALNQIRIWQDKFRNNPIREHVILFPYHAGPRHWNCGKIIIKFNGYHIVDCHMVIYEPLSSHSSMDNQVTDAIKTVLNKYFKFESRVTNEFKYTNQQSDGSSCGAISAENGKDIIDGRILKIKEFYSSGAHDLRLRHINEIKSRRFYEIQLRDEIYIDPQINLDAPWQQIQNGFKQVLEKIPEELKANFIEFIRQFKKNADYKIILANKFAVITPLILILKSVLINQKLSFFDVLFKNQDLDLANNGIDTLERLSGELATAVETMPPPRHIQTASSVLSSYFNRPKTLSITPLPTHVSKGDNYNKTKALIPGLEGVTYQVAILMKTAFESFERGEEFELLTEAADFEKFDDIVKHCKSPVEETIVTQVKHGHASDCTYTLNDFISDPQKKAKKVQLSKYFDSWLKIKAKMPKQNIVYQLISNYDINIAIEDKNFDKNKGEFSYDFIENKRLTAAEQAVRSEIFIKMREHAEGIEFIKLLADICFDININTFQSTAKKIVKILQKETYDAKGQGDLKKLIRTLLANYITIRGKDENLIKNNNKFIDNSLLSCVDKSELDKINENIKIKIPKNKGIQDVISEALGQLPTLKNDKIYKISEEKYLQVIVLLSGCLERAGDKYKLKQDFIYDNKLTSLQQTLRTHLITILKRDFPSVEQNKNISDDMIKEFLREFKLKTKYLSVQELDKALKAQMTKYFDNAFPGHYEAFYLEILTWLRDYSYSQNNKTIEAFFNIFKARLPWSDLIGITQDRLHRKYAEAPTLFDEKNHQLMQIDNFFHSREKLLIICCSSETTLSILMKDYLLKKNDAENNMTVGQYIFIKANQFFEHNNPEYYLLTLMQNDLKLIILDTVNFAIMQQHKNLLSILLAETVKQNKKVVLLFKLEQDNQFEWLLHSDYITEEIKQTEGKIIQIPQLDRRQMNIVIDNFHIDRELSVLNRVVQFDDGLKDLASLGRILCKYEFLLDSSKKPKRKSERLFEIEKDMLPLTMPVINRTRYYYDLDVLLQTVSQNIKCLQIQIDTSQSVDPLLQLLSVSLSKQSLFMKKTELSQYIFDNTFDDLKFEDDLNNINEQFLCIDLTRNNDVLSQQFLVNLLTKKNLILINLSTVSFHSIEGAFNIKITATKNNKFNCFVMSTHSLTLPTYEGKIKEDYGPYLNLLDNVLEKNRVLVTSKAGLGKSRLCKELQKYFYDSKVYNPKQYDFVFLIELSDILPEDLDCLASSNGETIYNIIIKKHKLSNITKHEHEFLAYSLNKGSVLLLFDGFDEILSFHLIKCKQLFEHLFGYSHYVITSRPDVVLPFSPTEIISLNQFDHNKIIETINHYYQSKSFQCRLNEDNFKITLPPKLIELLSIPLYCRLFCESYLQNDKLPTYHDLLSVTKLSIYQKILLNDLRSYLVKKLKVEVDSLTDGIKVLQLTYVTLKRLTHLAFQQIGLENTPIKYVDKLDTELNYLGFVKVQCLDGIMFCKFRHQTFMEYCAALSIAKGLCNLTKADYLQQLIIKHRYDGRFEVLWQFVARILIDGDPYLNDKNEVGLEKFCKALVAPPRDIVGNKHIHLIKSCFNDEDMDKIKFCDQYFKIFITYKEQNTPSSVNKAVQRHFNNTHHKTEMMYSEAINIFKNCTLDYRKDITPFINAYEKLTSLTSQELKLKAVDFAIGHLDQGLRLDKNKVLLFKSGAKKDSSWKNICGYLLMVIAKIGLMNIQQRNQELFIIKSLCELYKLTNNANALDSDLLTALSDFTIYSSESFQFLLNELAKSVNASFSKRIVKCLNQSKVDEKKIVGAVKENINAKILDIRYCSVMFCELLEYPFFEKNYLINTFINIFNHPLKSSADFVSALEFILKVSKIVSLEQAQTLLLRIFAIINHPDMAKFVIQNDKVMELIGSFLMQNHIQLQFVEKQLKQLFNRKDWKILIIKFLSEYDALDSTFIDECIAQENDKAETAQSFVNLPIHFLNERVLSFIITHADDYLIWDVLSQLFDKNYDATLFAQNLRDILINKAIQKLKGSFNIDKVLYILSFILDKEAIEKLYIDSMPRYLGYIKTDLIVQFSEMSLKYAWQKFCSTYHENRDMSLSSNWYFVIIAHYVEKNKLAVAVDNTGMILYGLTGNYVLEIDNKSLYKNEIISAVKKYFNQLRSQFYVQCEDLLNKLLRREKFEQSIKVSKINLLNQVQVGLFYHKNLREELTQTDAVKNPYTLHRRGSSS